MGNLKNRDLRGQELLSQTSVVEVFVAKLLVEMQK